MIIFLLTLFIISIILLIPTIMLQSGSDGGIMSSNITSGAFGAKSNEILIKFTSWLVTIFMVSALLLSIHFVKSSNLSYSDTASDSSEVIEEALPVDDSTLPIPE
ncbi:MAG: preprotein translocase subunit SecG [Brevinemataceae bacterium]